MVIRKIKSIGLKLYIIFTHKAVVVAVVATGVPCSSSSVVRCLPYFLSSHLA